MSADCCHPGRPAGGGTPVAAYRRVLWIALAVNAAMFVLEAGAGLATGSVALQADALDFLGDAANYGLGLAVLGMALAWRARAALLKGASMGLFGLWVLGSTLYHAIHPGEPGALTMGAVGLLALAANVGVALLLYRHRNGDSNRRSIWLCTRNDAIGNIAVVAAASGVFATGSAWPDLLVGAIMAGLALTAARRVIGQATVELRGPAAAAGAAE